MAAAAPVGALFGLAAVSAFFGACASCADETPSSDAGAPCLDCPKILSVDPPDGSIDVETNPVIRFETDVHLDDETVSGSAFELYSGSISMWLLAYYDPVRRVTSVWPSSHLREDAEWILESKEGIADRQGDPLEAGIVTRFTTGEGEGDDAPFPEKRYAPDLKAIFDAKCASCHGGESPLAGLALDTASGVTATAIGVASSGHPSMKRVEPARPGGSYLVYKVLGDPLISGQPMPCSFDGATVEGLTAQELQTTSDWIAGGAVMGP